MISRLLLFLWTTIKLNEFPHKQGLELICDFNPFHIISAVMVLTCAVLGCPNKQSDGKGVLFHRFPTNVLQREKWMMALKCKKDDGPGPFGRICSKHFKSGDYKSTMRLKNDAVPSIFKPYPTDIQENTRGEREWDLEYRSRCENGKESSIPIRRSSRNVKPINYAENKLNYMGTKVKGIKKDSDDGAGKKCGINKAGGKDEAEGDDDVVEVVPSDPLAMDEISFKNAPSGLVPVSSVVTLSSGGARNSKGKEPTVVIVDINSILRGREPVPLTPPIPATRLPIKNLARLQSNSTGIIKARKFNASARPSAPAPFSMPEGAHINASARPSTSSPFNAFMRPSTSFNASTRPSILAPFTVPVDARMMEAPSFVVPYFYEKNPEKSLKEFVANLRSKAEVKMDVDGNTDKVEIAGKKEETDKNAGNLKKGSSLSLSSSFFDQPLGKFFTQLGLNFVQERVYKDLLKSQRKRKHRVETQMAVDALKDMLEGYKEWNELFHEMKMKKCRFCDFKTESNLVYAHHLEMPHVKNYNYVCNFCQLEFRSAHDVIYHVKVDHGVKCRWQVTPGPHQCPNCMYEHFQKAKVTRHVESCQLKFQPEKNQEPPWDWEPPVKIAQIIGIQPATNTLVEGNASYPSHNMVAVARSEMAKATNTLLLKTSLNAAASGQAAAYISNGVVENKANGSVAHTAGTFPGLSNDKNVVKLFQSFPGSAQLYEMARTKSASQQPSASNVTLRKGVDFGPKLAQYQVKVSIPGSNDKMMKLLNHPSISLIPLPMKSTSSDGNNKSSGGDSNNNDDNDAS